MNKIYAHTIWKKYNVYGYLIQKKQDDQVKNLSTKCLDLLQHVSAQETW